LKELTKEAKDLVIGQRKEVKWKEHIDQDKKAVASAVAREMFTKLPALFNRQNEALGMESRVRRMKDLVSILKSSDQSDLVLMMVNRLDVIGDARKLAQHLEGVTRQDYEWRSQISLSSQ